MCSHCGYLLFTFPSDPPSTIIPPKRPVQPPSELNEERLRKVELLGADTLLLYIVLSKSELIVSFTSPMILGRYSVGSNHQPDIDLSVYNGIALGISRQHASIQRTDNRLSIKDLNSSNGTKLNDQRLEPYKEYPLNSGDRLDLSQILIEIYFNKSQIENQKLVNNTDNNVDNPNVLDC